jgi:hypothetical protein
MKLGIFFVLIATVVGGCDSKKTAPVLPPTPAASQPASGELSGGAWIRRNDGSSDILRGIEIRLLVPAVSRKILAASSAEAIAEAQAFVKSEREYFTNHYNTSDAYKQDRDTRLARVAEVEKAVREVEQFIQSGTADVDAAHAYDLLAAVNPYGVPSFGAIASANTTQTAQADINGLWKLTAAPGKYYVHAFFRSSAGSAEWLVPVTINPASNTKLDLFNENAIRL